MDADILPSLLLLLLLSSMTLRRRCFALISDRLIVCSQVPRDVAMVTADDVIAGVT